MGENIKSYRREKIINFFIKERLWIKRYFISKNGNNVILFFNYLEKV